MDYALYLSFKWALIVHLAYFIVVGNDAEEVNSLKFCLDTWTWGSQIRIMYILLLKKICAIFYWRKLRWWDTSMLMFILSKSQDWGNHWQDHYSPTMDTRRWNHAWVLIGLVLLMKKVYSWCCTVFYVTWQFRVQCGLDLPTKYEYWHTFQLRFVSFGLLHAMI